MTASSFVLEIRKYPMDIGIMTMLKKVTEVNMYGDRIS
jgi:hypothetical protein